MDLLAQIDKNNENFKETGEKITRRTFPDKEPFNYFFILLKTNSSKITYVML